MHRRVRLYRNPYVLAAVLVAGLLVAVSGTAAGFAYAYRDSFYPGVSVAGIAVGGLSREEGAAKVHARAEEYVAHKFMVVVPDASKPLENSPNRYEDKELPATGKELGLSFPVDSAIDEAWSRGHESTFGGWIKTGLPALISSYKQPLPYAVDRPTLQAFIITKVSPSIGAPIPAKVAVSGTSVAIEPAKPGFTTDPKALEELLVSKLSSASDSDVTYVRAPVTASESVVTKQAVQPVAERLDALANVPLSLTVGAKTLKPTRQQMLSWYSPVQDEQEKVSLVVSKEAISQYLATDSTVDSAKSLTPVLNTATSLLSKALQDLKNPVSVALAAKPVKKATDSFTANRNEGKYIEIDLKTQKLYLVETDKLVKSYVVSSGKWSTPTPTGTFTVRNKARRPLSAAYGLYLPYWVDFLGGEYGLHELPEWPNGYKEGQNHLGIPVSHGCVRLGIGDAKEVYEWTPIGTPIYIH